MEYISSDTNVWIDFQEIGKLELPFRLPYVYLMNDEAVMNYLVRRDLAVCCYSLACRRRN